MVDEEPRRNSDLQNDLARRESQYQSDLVRLDRFQGTLDEREKRLAEREAAIERRTAELEERERTNSEITQQHREQSDELGRLQSELAGRQAALTDRERALEAQQSAMASLRVRMERTRDEVRQEAALLVEQRARQDATERSLQEQIRQIDERRNEIAANQAEFEERSATMKAALIQLRQVEEQLSTETTALETRRRELDERTAELDAAAEELQRQTSQLTELQQRLDADRNAVTQRDAAIGQTDEARRTLQEQLQRRADELATREKQLDEAARLQSEAAAEIDDLRQRLAQARAEIDDKWTAAEKELQQRSAALDDRITEIDGREDALRRHVQKLRAVGAAVAAERKASHVAQSRWTVEQNALVTEADALRTELETFRQRTARESDQFQQQIPELELRGEAVLARLAQAREQLRAHVAELHDYTRQCHHDLQSLRSQLQSDYERVRASQLAAQHERSEHRLAVTAFRQQLIEWQGRIAEMRQWLTQDGTRLEWKQAEVVAAARELDAACQKLARQAADLSAQEREVNERRSEVDRHLGDMREWYRKKLRELAQATPAAHPNPLVEESPKLAIAADTVSVEFDPADRQLGELLQSLDLIEPDALAKLLGEAQRQRRSLRQVLLASREGGMPLLTLYQLALIEAGNLDGLVLGPLRVVDRLMVTPSESVYRVFDPRRGSAALLRHLGEAEAIDEARAAEFRSRFAAAMAVRHDNIAATMEVLDIQGRPAVLQEWTMGLASTDWPPTAAAPGVWFRLMMQMALGLDAAHRCGMCHGHLSPRTVLVTGVGVLKILGLGDPPWLAGVETEATVAGDLIALGGLAASWAALAPRRRANKPPKPLPPPLRAVMDRLRPDAERAFSTASEVLTALEEAGAKLPDASDAWDELLEHASQSGAAPAVWRKSA